MDTIAINAFAIVYWQIFAYFLFAINVVISKETFGQTLASFLTAFVMELAISYGVTETRKLVFCGLYHDRPYCTPRPNEHPVLNKLSSLEAHPYFPYWLAFHICYFLAYPYSVAPEGSTLMDSFSNTISLVDWFVLAALWLVTDVIFTIYHRSNHVYNYKAHKPHHGLAHPTPYQPDDHFWIFDGTGHVVCYMCGAFTVQMAMEVIGMEMTSMVWWLGCYQWMILGQIHHGGKDVDANMVVGMEFLRQGLGFTASMTYLHDVHHQCTNYNYGMTGMGDQWIFGTLAECYPYERKADFTHAPGERAEQMRQHKKKD